MCCEEAALGTCSAVGRGSRQVGALGAHANHGTFVRQWCQLRLKKRHFGAMSRARVCKTGGAQLSGVRGVSGGLKAVKLQHPT